MNSTTPCSPFFAKIFVVVVVVLHVHCAILYPLSYMLSSLIYPPQLTVIDFSLVVDFEAIHTPVLVESLNLQQYRKL